MPGHGRRQASGVRLPESPFQRLTIDLPQTKAFVISSAIMRPATGQTSRCAPERTRAPEFAETTGTDVKIGPRPPENGKRQRVTSGFTADPKVSAGAPPLRPVRPDAPPAGAKVRQQVRQLMSQGPIDFGLTMRAEQRVQEHEILAAVGPSRRASQPVRPFHFYMNSRQLRTQADEQVPRRRLELRIAPEPRHGRRAK